MKGSGTMKPGRYYAFLAVAGFAAMILLFGYAEATNYSEMNLTIRLLATLLCPAFLPAPWLLFDLNAHSSLMTVAWLIMAMMNSGIYVAVGAVVRAILQKRARSVTS
jgi:hypothetical protein